MTLPYPDYPDSHPSNVQACQLVALKDRVERLENITVQLGEHVGRMTTILEQVSKILEAYVKHLL